MLTADTPFETQVAGEDCAVHVLGGEIDLHWTATGDPVRVPAGSAVLVPAGRLYGLRAGADAAVAVGPAR